MPTNDIEDSLNDILDASDEPNPQHGQQELSNDILEMMDARAASSESPSGEPSSTTNEEEIKELMVPFIRAGDFETASKIYTEQTGKGPTDAQNVTDQIRIELGLPSFPPQDRRSADLEAARKIATDYLREGNFKEAARVLRIRLGYTDEAARKEAERLQKELGSSPSQPRTGQSSTPPPQELPLLSRQPTWTGRKHKPGGLKWLPNSSLGTFVDGWSDLVEGMGYKDNEVIDHVYDRLLALGMPHDIRVKDTYVKPSLVRKKREYILMTNKPGVNTTVYVRHHGQDLFVSWHTYLHATINWLRLLVLLVIALVPSLCTGIFGLVGFQLTKSFYGQGSGNTAVLNSPGFTAYSFIVSFIAMLIAFFIVECLILVFAGILVKGNPYYYLCAEANIFDVEDISAMSLAAHKSLLKALDDAKIGSKLVRPKQDFRTGRREDRA